MKDPHSAFVPKTVLFDLDGTLTDPEEGIVNSIVYALGFLGIKETDRASLRRFIGPPLKRAFMGEYGMSDSEAAFALQKYREYFSERGIFENRLYDGIGSFLAALKEEGKTVALATSKPTVFAEKILSHFGLSRYFDRTAGSELDGTRSDKAEVISHALGLLGNPDRRGAVMVGDRLHDVEGAKKEGLYSIGVLYGFGSRAELTGAGADALAESVDELLSLLTGRA